MLMNNTHRLLNRNYGDLPYRTSHYWYDDPTSKMNSFDIFQLNPSLSYTNFSLNLQSHQQQLNNQDNSILKFIKHSQTIQNSENYELLMNNYSCPDKFFQMEAIGSFGDLMFEYAAIVGLCIKRGFPPNSCAIITPSNSSSKLHNKSSFIDFIQEFNIQSPSYNCQLQVYENYTENMFVNSSYICYDKYVSHLPLATSLKGYFHSYKYFYPEANEFIHQIYTFSSNTITVSNDIIKSIELEVASQSIDTKLNYTLVCMGYIDMRSLSYNYYLQAIMKMKKKYERIAIVIFMNQQDHKDIKKIQENIINMLQVETMEGHINFLNHQGINNSMILLRSLSLCPNIIIDSSSLSWWSAFLSLHSNIIAPRDLFFHDNINFLPIDYYPTSWILIHDDMKSPKTFPFTSNPIPSNTSMNMFTTVVSSYFIIPSKYEHSTYMKWISNFMKMNFKCIIYVNQLSYNILNKKYPETNNRKYILMELSEMYFNQQNWNKTLQMNIYPSLSIKHNHSWDLFAIWGEKVFMVENVIKLNPFFTDTFCWTDIGAFRDTGISLLNSRIGYPNPLTFNINKVSFPLINSFNKKDLINIYHIDNRFLKTIHIGGGHFVGGSKAFLIFAKLYREILQEAINHNVFIGIDQHIFAFLTLRHPNIFDLIPPKCSKSTSDKWFCIQDNWSFNGIDVNSPNIKALTIKTLANDKQCDIYFLIASSSMSLSRNSIRSGWLDDLTSLYPSISFKYKFFLGRDIELEEESNKSLHYEINTFNDIIVLPFIESISNKTTKMTIMLKWAILDTPQCKYFFKMYDYVDIRAYKVYSMYQRLLSEVKSEYVYGGRIVNHMNQSSVSKMMDVGISIPYASSPFYFLSNKLIQHLPYSLISKETIILNDTIEEVIPSIYENYKGTHEYLKEDVFLGHLVASLTPTLNISYVNIKFWITTNPMTNKTNRHWFSAMDLKSVTIKKKVMDKHV